MVKFPEISEGDPNREEYAKRETSFEIPFGKISDKNRFFFVQKYKLRRITGYEKAPIRAKSVTSKKISLYISCYKKLHNM